MVEALPVDTHVWQIAQRDYNFGKGKHKSLTKSTYDAIGDFFRMLWGKEAGWAHSVLFATDLRTFAIRVATKDVKAEAMNIKLEGDITQTLTEKRAGGIGRGGRWAQENDTNTRKEKTGSGLNSTNRAIGV